MVQCSIVILLLIGAVSAVSIPNLAPLRPLEENEKTIAEEYIVIFKKAASEIDVQKHMKFVDYMMLKEPNDTYRVKHVYHMGPNFRGYAALMTDQMLQIVRGMQEVEYVERNQRGEYAETEQGFKFCINQDLAYENWGLSRISHSDIQSPPLTYRYNLFEGGLGVHIYIVDSGIDTTNPDFGGRAEWGINVGGGPNEDPVGHGTNVAGCAMSTTYGAAKLGTAIAVGIDRDGYPATDLVIAGFQWVQKNHKKDKSIANASVTVGEAVNEAADALIDSGVPLVAAAGNYDADACFSHPASVERVITVAASDRADNFAIFSNHGNCVDIIAPGVNIQTTGKNNNNPTTTSGTSFSSPYTAGIIAAIMENETPDRAVELMFERSIFDKIEGVPADTPNRLLNNVC